MVDFWATWCVPCKVLGPLLERLTAEADGGFRLARVDVDANPNLALRYNVRSIPVVKGFRGGQVATEFTGSLPEPRVREFLARLAPAEGDLALEKAGSLLALHDWATAERAYREILTSAPHLPAALLGLSRSLLARGAGAEAALLLRGFPASREFSTAEMLLPLAEAFVQVSNPPVEDDDPLEPAFRNSLRLAARGNIPSALDGLLDILRQDKHYRSGLGRKVFVALLDLLGPDDPLARQYRSELATVLF